MNIKASIFYCDFSAIFACTLTQYNKGRNDVIIPFQSKNNIFVGYIVYKILTTKILKKSLCDTDLHDKEKQIYLYKPN